ncbi:hypothetical protein C8T65DRAFT_526127, partial [Cerioporus squamosus]
HQVGSITMDSASNNDTKMEGLEDHFEARGITFSSDGNRVRYVLHDYLYAYSGAVATDPIKSVRELVGVCRRSGTRRADLRRKIIQGNAANLWGAGVQVPERQLLRDSDTRWSSTHQMVGRTLSLYPAIRTFLQSEDHSDLAEHALTQMQLRVLTDIHQILMTPHGAQELLSSSRTPTVSMALPAYELAIESWNNLKTKIPEMAHHIQAGIDRLEKYVKLARKTRIYALAMILNPIFKLEWMEKHWSREDMEAARGWMLDLVWHLF